VKALLLEKGGSALVMELDGERVTLLSPVAAPPGSSLVGSYEGARVVIKARGSRRVEPDTEGRTFRVEGRFVGLTRELREKLGAP
jgi:hypothetical protein